MVSMPPPGKWDDEIIIQNQQLEVINVLEEFLSNECDESGKPKGMVNLTKMQDLGRKELIEGIKNKK